MDIKIDGKLVDLDKYLENIFDENNEIEALSSFEEEETNFEKIEACAM